VVGVNEDLLKQELEQHPDLAPMMDVDEAGRVVCYGWTTPVHFYEKPQEEM